MRALRFAGVRALVAGTCFLVFIVATALAISFDALGVGWSAEPPPTSRAVHAAVLAVTQGTTSALPIAAEAASASLSPRVEIPSKPPSPAPVPRAATQPAPHWVGPVMPPRADPSSPSELRSPHMWLSRRYAGGSRRLPPNRRISVVSLGGVGTTPLMDTLKARLKPFRVDVADVNDRDGLKHTTYSPLSRGAIAAFDPALVIYVIGNPAAAIASHYRRRWPGSQLCLVNPAAESLLATHLALNSTMDPPPGANYFANYTRVVAASRVDYFAAYEHAASWLGATELGFTVVWATLPTLIASQASLVRLLDINATVPFFEFPIRNSTSWTPVGQPPAFLELYNDITARLVASFDGACASPDPHVCSAAGLRPAPDAAPFNASLAEGFRALRTHPSNINAARRMYIRLLPGVCGGHLRPKPRVRPKSNQTAALRWIQMAQAAAAEELRAAQAPQQNARGLV